MKRTFVKIIDLVLMVFLLLSTSGMTLYKLHCNCLHHNHVSIFVEPESCHNHLSSDDCHCGGQECSWQTHYCANCDTHESLFVKLTTEFLFENGSAVSAIELMSFMSIIFFDQLSISRENENRSSSSVENSPPSTLSGQKMITLFHQFKFDLSSSVA